MSETLSKMDKYVSNVMNNKLKPDKRVLDALLLGSMHRLVVWFITPCHCSPKLTPRPSVIWLILRLRYLLVFLRWWCRMWLLWSIWAISPRLNWKWLNELMIFSHLIIQITNFVVFLSFFVVLFVICKQGKRIKQYYISASASWTFRRMACSTCSASALTML